MSLVKILYILALSGFLAGYSAWVESDRASRPHLSVVSGRDQIALVRLREAEALWREPSTVFLDARSATDYAYGHIRGALSFPEEDFERRFPILKERLQKARVIVVYCKNEDCAKSLWTAIRLRNEGLTQVKIYPQGWYEWTEHGKPVSRPPPR